MNFRTRYAFHVLKIHIVVTVTLCFAPCLACAQDVPAWQRRINDIAAGLFGPPKIRNGNSQRIWSGEPPEYFKDPKLVEVCETISKDDLQKLKALLNNPDVEINSEGQGGMTILYFAFLEGKLQAFETLLQHGASPDLIITQELPISPGIIGLWPRTKNLSVVLFSLLSERVRPGFFDAALSFTKKPNQTDKNGNTILHLFAASPYSDQDLPRLKSMVVAGVDLDLKNIAGESAVEIAVRYNPKLLFELLKAGSDPSISTSSGASLIKLINSKSAELSRSPKEDYDEVAQWLNDRGVHP